MTSQAAHAAAATPAAADFRQIKGISASIARHLYAAQICSFAELAALTPAAIAERLASVKGVSAKRIAREDWPGQARALAVGFSTNGEAPMELSVTPASTAVSPADMTLLLQVLPGTPPRLQADVQFTLDLPAGSSAQTCSVQVLVCAFDSTATTSFAATQQALQSGQQSYTVALEGPLPAVGRYQTFALIIAPELQLATATLGPPLRIDP